MVKRWSATVAAVVLVCMAHGAHALTPFHIAGDQNGEPQEFINDQGDFVGPFVTTMRAVFDQLGLPLRHDPYEWQAAQDLVRDGGADALITVLTPARAEYLVSNQVALAELNWVVTVRGDHPQRDELLAKTRLEDFVGYEVLDYAGNGWGIANLGGLNVTREGTIADNLRKLATGTGDLLINLEGGTEQTVAGLLQTNPTDADAAELQALVTGSNVLGVSEMNLLVRKDSPYVDLIPQIDAVLRTLLGDQSAVSVPVNTPWLLWSLVLALALVAQRRLRA